jgi:hypothetical protein
MDRRSKKAYNNSLETLHTHCAASWACGRAYYLDRRWSFESFLNFALVPGFRSRMSAELTYQVAMWVLYALYMLRALNWRPRTVRGPRHYAHSPRVIGNGCCPSRQRERPRRLRFFSPCLASDFPDRSRGHINGVGSQEKLTRSRLQSSVECVSCL